MKKLLLMAGAAMMVAAAPAVAGKPAHAGAKAHVNAGAKAHVKSSKAVKARDVTRAGVRGDRNRNGIADWRERWIDRDRDGVDDRREASMRRYGGAECPPGLAKDKRVVPCVPPGQIGKRGGPVPVDWDYIDYSDIPERIRDRYDLDDDYRYIYRDRRLYVVDPTTPLILRVLNAIRF